MKDTDEEIDTAEIEEEEWIEYMKRSTATAIERMKAVEIQCGLKHTEKWNGVWKWELHRFQMYDGQRKQQNGTAASESNTRHDDWWEDQKKRWEDEINEFLKPAETEEMKGNEIKNNDTWIKVAKNRERWKAMESEYATTAAAASVDRVHSRRCP